MKKILLVLYTVLFAVLLFSCTRDTEHHIGEKIAFSKEYTVTVNSAWETSAIEIKSSAEADELTPIYRYGFHYVAVDLTITRDSVSKPGKDHKLDEDDFKLKDHKDIKIFRKLGDLLSSDKAKKDFITVNSLKDYRYYDYIITPGSTQDFTIYFELADVNIAGQTISIIDTLTFIEVDFGITSKGVDILLNESESITPPPTPVEYITTSFIDESQAAEGYGLAVLNEDGSVTITPDNGVGSYTSFGSADRNTPWDLDTNINISLKVDVSTLEVGQYFIFVLSINKITELETVHCNELRLGVLKVEEGYYVANLDGVSDDESNINAILLGTLIAIPDIEGLDLRFALSSEVVGSSVSISYGSAFLFSYETEGFLPTDEDILGFGLRTLWLAKTNASSITVSDLYIGLVYFGITD